VPYRSAIDNTLTKALAAAAGRSVKVATFPTLTIGFTDARFVREVGTPALGFTPEHPKRDKVMNRAHGANESVPVRDLEFRVRCFAAMIALTARPAEGEGMATGDVVNTCSRLQAAAPVDGILVDEPTYRATSSTIEYREAEPVLAKGKAEPVAAWEVVAPRTRLGVDIAFRGGAELVGRRDELRLLRDAVARSERERSPQLVTLVGAPGIGKSRLLYELWSALSTDPSVFVYWRQGRSLPYGEGVSFWALGEMVKAQAGVLETDDAVREASA